MAVTKRLENKVAIITGTAGGIGRATALRFATEGASIIAADVADDANAETVAMVSEAGGTATAVSVDVTDDAQVESMVATAVDTYGGLDIIFNNAGVMLSGDDDAVSTPDDIIDATLAINVKGVILGCRHAIPAMRERGGGSIVNTASFVATMGAATPLSLIHI